MSIKKEPAQTGSQGEGGSVGSPKSESSKAKGARRFKVEFFPDGVALNAPSMGRSHSKSGTIKRGKIKGWSKSSRRRMREFLLTHPIGSGFDCYAVTYTIPGPVLEPSEAKRLFNNWQMSLHRLGGCAVWRLEVQQRGALHWHITVGLPSDIRPLPFDSLSALPAHDRHRLACWSRSVKSDEFVKGVESGLWSNACLLSDLWLRALDTLGPVEEPMTKKSPDFVRNVLRSEWKGAKEHAVNVIPFDDQFGAWKRYLQDHNTKSKQEQIADGFGRHWGVIGRDRFEKVLPDSVVDLNFRQYSAFLRCYQRLCTPARIAPWSVFGRCLGSTSKRGRSGRSIYFSNPATVQRLVFWASDLPEQLPRVPRWHDATLKPLQKSKVGQTLRGTPRHAEKVKTAEIYTEDIRGIHVENTSMIEASLKRTVSERERVARRATGGGLAPAQRETL